MLVIGLKDDVEGRLFREEMISAERAHQVHQKIVHRAVAGMLQLKAIKPAQRALPPTSYPVKDFMAVDAPVVADPQVCGIGEVDATGLARATGFKNSIIGTATLCCNSTKRL